MYERFVVTSLLRDLLYILAFPFFGGLIYFGAGLYRQEYRGCVLGILGLTFGGMMLLAIVSEFSCIYDYLQYLQHGDSYVQEATCEITEARSGTSAGLLMARQRLYCADGQEFITKYRRDYQRLAWRWAQERRVLRIRYLPRSRLILEAAPSGGTD